MKYKILLILLVVISFSACGGGSSKESPSDSENNADDIKNTSSIETEAVMLSNLQGLWRGELKVFVDGTETPECIWDVSLDLSSTRVIDGSKFKGEASAELIFKESNNNVSCKSGTSSIDWAGFCLSGYGYKQNNISCMISLDGVNYDDDHVYGYKDLESLLGSPLLSYDKKTMWLSRSNRDKPYLRLIRER